MEIKVVHYQNKEIKSKIKFYCFDVIT